MAEPVISPATRRASAMRRAFDADNCWRAYAAAGRYAHDDLHGKNGRLLSGFCALRFSPAASDHYWHCSDSFCSSCLLMPTVLARICAPQLPALNRHAAQACVSLSGCSGGRAACSFAVVARRRGPASGTADGGHLDRRVVCALRLFDDVYGPAQLHGVGARRRGLGAQGACRRGAFASQL